MSLLTLSLPAGFSLHEGTPADLSDMMKVMEIAFENDGPNRVVTKDVVRTEDIHPYMVEHYAPRWALPDIKVWKVVEDESGKMVAWAAVQRPWNITPEMTPEIIGYLKAPPNLLEDAILEGANIEAFGELVAADECTESFGYDPLVDFQRKTTAVLPSYQKRKIGSFLTQTINAYTDTFVSPHNKTYVQMRPKSISMFTRYGFKDIGFYDAHLERWGGDREESISRIAVRVAGGKE